MTSLARDIDEYVAANEARYLRQLHEYVARPSVSSTGEGVESTAEFAAGLMTAAGLVPRIMPTAGSPVVLGHAAGPPGTPHVLIYGHYDVQPPGPLEHWISPPFAPEVRDGRIYGRGTGDNKGQHLAHLLALTALREVRGGPPCSVTVLLDGEEELGSPNLPAFAERHRDLLGADLVLWSDGPVHDGGRSCVTLGVRGIVKFALHARGAAYPTHSGNWGGVAPNPAWRLVEVLSSMRTPDGHVLIDGFYDGVPPVGPEERAALAALPVDVPAVLEALAVRAFEPPAERGFHERLAAWPTLTINTLTCEDAGEHRTVIPAVAVAGCDVRLVAGQSAVHVERAIAAHVATVAPDVEFVPLAAMEPAGTPMSAPYLDAVREGVAAGFGEEPLIVPSLGGSLPLYAFTGILGLPTYGVPIANVDEANHAPNENLEVWRFFAGIRMAAAVLLRLAACGQVR